MPAPPYDVFLSHSSKDKDFVKELYRRLTRDGVRCFFDIESIGWGDNWVRALERAIDECSYIVFVLSPDFCNSEWVEVERTSSIAGDPSGLKRKVRPLMLHPCRDLPTFPRFLRQVRRLTFPPTRYSSKTTHASAANSAANRNPTCALKCWHCRMADRMREDHLSQFDIFLSHSHVDAHAVEALGARLEDEGGFRVWLDKWVLVPGAHWQQEMARGLEQARTCVVCIGQNTPKGWFREEVERAINRQTRDETFRVIPVILPDGDSSVIDNFLELRTWVNFSNGIGDSEAFHLLKSGVTGVSPGRRQSSTTSRNDLVVADRSKLPPVHPLPKRHWMPYHSLGDKFVGRVSAIWNLYDSLFHDGTTVLQGTGVVAGTGGLGKTQLAIEYAHRFGPVYTGGVYWVNADRGLTEMITRISAEAGIDLDTKAEEAEQVAQLWHDLNARNLPCLVVLDNLPEDVALRPYLPTTGRVHTIVTTRRQDLEQATVRLPVLSISESVQLLNSGARQLGQSAEALAERLGGLPLALELSKSYLNYRRDLSVPALIDEMKREGDVSVLQEFASEYRDQLPSRHELDVVSTFQLSWQIASDPAKKILRVMGELAPTTVPKKLLRIILNLPLQSPFRDELSKGIDDLARLSLVELSSNGDPVAHRLVLAFTRHRNVVDDPSPFERCGEVLFEQLRRATLDSDAETMRELETFLPHAEFLAATGRLGEEILGELLDQLGVHHETMGRFTAARDALRQALASAERSLADGDPTIARRKSTLALVFRDLGELGEARDLLRAALASDERTYEAGHREIAAKQSNLATVLQDLGQLEEARDLLRQALASDEKSFEPGHPSIAIRQSNLATGASGSGAVGRGARSAAPGAGFR